MFLLKKCKSVQSIKKYLDRMMSNTGATVDKRQGFYTNYDCGLRYFS
jgi:hypothetical protein